MEVTGTFHAPDRSAWRAWLEANHGERDEVWLVTYRKAADRPSIGYNDAVEEALCFGWIDGIRRSLDDGRLAQRFTPRRPGSPLSQTNLERLARLIERGRVPPSVLDRYGDARAEDFVVPADIEAALRADPDAWRHWCSFSPSYRRIRAAYVDHARDRGEAEFGRRLEHLVRKTASGKQFGYDIERYY